MASQHALRSPHVLPVALPLLLLLPPDELAPALAHAGNAQPSEHEVYFMKHVLHVEANTHFVRHEMSLHGHVCVQLM